jgi:hypothetical protein
LLFGCDGTCGLTPQVLVFLKQTPNFHGLGIKEFVAVKAEKYHEEKYQKK